MGNVTGGHTAECPPSRVVKTKYGEVEGRRLIHEGEKQVDAFQGIPFAKPPVGELRFKKPVPPESWEGVKETKKFAARGMQKDHFFFAKWKIGPTSEDNLYLNVFTPVWSPSETSAFPVLVFIHGGGFVSDSAVKYGDIGICKHLVTKDVVVVTIQYRLGLLGFFSTGTEECLGNFAMWDMTMALQWVQDNISAFNGDPNNVTIMGQSAGGASVDLLTLSPFSRDLFHKVIPMAGNASADWALLWDMDASCRRHAEKLGIDSHHDCAKYLDDLRKLEAHNFALGLTFGKAGDEVFCPIGPRVDGEFFSKSVREMRKEAPAKPRMVGCCRSEGLMALMMGGTNNLAAIEEGISKLVKEKHHPNFSQLRAEVLSKLLADPTTKDKDLLNRALGELSGDMFMNVAVQKNVLECIELDAPVYFYSFDFCNPKSWGPLGMKMPYKDATHCTEICYIFGVSLVWNFDYTPDDVRVLEITTTLWTNFCKFGNPNGPEGKQDPVLEEFKVPIWEPATTEQPQKHLSIQLEPKLVEQYKEGRPQFLAELHRKEHEAGQRP